MLKIRAFLILSLVFLYFVSGSPQTLRLEPTNFINDYTGTLSEQQKTSLEDMVATIERETSAEIGVVIIQNLEGRDIEGYANEIFNSWGIGKKGKDNGVLILVSLNDRKIRIETGYGLEPVLPDAVCGRIIRNIMAPGFRENKYYDGIYNAITAIAQYIKGEEPPAAVAGLPDKGKFIPFLIMWHGFLLFFAFSIFRKPGIIIYLLVVVPLGVMALFSERYAEQSAAMGLMMLVPFFLVFFMGLFAPVIYTILAWRLKKKYKNKWKNHMPVYINNAVSRTGSSRGGFSGGGFGGGSSGGGGASGGW